jgi:hypothetical protein
MLNGFEYPLSPLVPIVADWTDRMAPERRIQRSHWERPLSALIFGPETKSELREGQAYVPPIRKFLSSPPRRK